MTQSATILVLAVMSLAVALPGVQADAPAPAAPTDGSAKCAPPCGYIFPTIGVEADLKKEQLRTSKLGTLPTTVPIDITYSWDMEQDGTGIPGDAEEMTITLVVSKKPVWLDTSLGTTVCSFQLVPIINEYDVCTIEMTLEVDPEHVPVVESDLDQVGKRLMLFAVSEESGTFKKSYGVEDIRWTFDASPEIDGMTVGPATAPEEAPGSVLAPAALVIALAAFVGRRRRS